jgi:hypothetical protein
LQQVRQNEARHAPQRGDILVVAEGEFDLAARAPADEILQMFCSRRNHLLSAANDIAVQDDDIRCHGLLKIAETDGDIAGSTIEQAFGRRVATFDFRNKLFRGHGLGTGQLELHRFVSKPAERCTIVSMQPIRPRLQPLPPSRGTVPVCEPYSS